MFESVFGMKPKTRANAAKGKRTYREQQGRERVAAAGKKFRKSAAKSQLDMNNGDAFSNLLRVTKREEPYVSRTRKKYKTL